MREETDQTMRSQKEIKAKKYDECSEANIKRK